MRCIFTGSLHFSYLWASTCYCNELTTAFVQVIPYVAELLAKVHEQQAQAERIIGFQSLFKCVYYIICMDVPCSKSYLSVLHVTMQLPARCTVHRVKACVDSSNRISMQMQAQRGVLCF
jgi:hypothetical protein